MSCLDIFISKSLPIIESMDISLKLTNSLESKHVIYIYGDPGFDSGHFLFFSCVYQELINDKSKHKKKNVTIYIVLPFAIPFVSAFVLYSIYIYL